VEGDISGGEGDAGILTGKEIERQRRLMMQALK
jgi:hypothetical protein